MLSKQHQDLGMNDMKSIDSGHMSKDESDKGKLKQNLEPRYTSMFDMKLHANHSTARSKARNRRLMQAIGNQIGSKEVTNRKLNQSMEMVGEVRY